MTIDWGWWGKQGRAGSLIIAVSALVLVSCGGGGSDEDSPTPVATVSATEAPVRPTQTPIAISLSNVVWTTAIDPETREPQDDVSEYAIDAPVIIAAIQVGTVPANAVLTATWSINGVEVPAVTMQATTETALKDGWATFMFAREEGHRFPVGELEVRITASDGTEVTGSVDIVVPQN